MTSFHSGKFSTVPAPPAPPKNMPVWLCREALKKKTAEAKGNQKEYQRVYRQQKAVEPESAEETANDARNFTVLEFVK